MKTALLSLGMFVAAGCGGTSEPPPGNPPPGSASAPADPPKPADPKEPVVASKAGPAGFPLPMDAEDGGPAPGGGGKIVVYSVPRSPEAVTVELKKLLGQGGWTVDALDKSPRGTVRLTVSKGATSVKASIAGEGSKSAIILTVP